MSQELGVRNQELGVMRCELRVQGLGDRWLNCYSVILFIAYCLGCLDGLGRLEQRKNPAYLFVDCEYL